MRDKLIKSSALLIAITIITKLLGLAREMVMANYVGTSTVSDAYVLGTTLSQIIVTGFAGSFFKTYLPVATEERYKSEKAYVDFSAQLLFAGSFLFFLICSVIYATASFTTKWLSSGASSDVVSMSINVCRATAIPSMFLFAINVLQGYLHAQERFMSNIVFPLVMNIVIIVSMIIGQGSISSLSNGYSVSIIMSALLLWIYCRKCGLKNASIKKFYTNNAVRKVILLTLPLFGGGLVSEINELIDRCFSAYYEAGTLTALRYGKLLEIFMVSAIGIAVGQAVYPKIARLKQENRIKDLEDLLSRIITVFCIVCFPLFAGIIYAGRDLVNVIFLRGAFDVNSAYNTSLAFVVYSLSILPVSINEILSRVFFSYNDTRRPVIYSMIAMGINIILNILVVFGLHLDFYALAFTTSVSETVMAIFHFVGSRKVLRLHFHIKRRTIMEALLCSGIMLFFLIQAGRLIPEVALIKLVFSVVAGCFVYFGLLGSMNIKKIEQWINHRGG